MLRLHMLNVGHGDSMIVEYMHEDETLFGVIDSNLTREHSTPRALSFLQSKGVNKLAFLALTHPHRDHVAGLGAIAQAFQGRVGLFLSHPVPRDDRVTKLKKLSAEQMKVVEEPQRTFISEFLRFLVAAENEASKDGRWECPDGLSNEIFSDDFTQSGLQVSVLLPAPSMKHWFFSDLSEGKIEFGGERQNELSLAIKIVYAGVTIVLGGDAEKQAWLYRSRYAPAPGAMIAKLPHHGSKHDCSPEVLDHIYGPSQPAADPGKDMPEEELMKIALISANGNSHPSPEVLAHLYERGIAPFCTSRAKICNGGASVTQLITDPELDKELLRSIRAYASDSTLSGACQGDVTVEITSAGKISVLRQYNTPCGFRKINPLPNPLIL